MKQFQQDFFNKPKDIAVAEFKRRVDTFLGPNNVGTKHIAHLARITRRFISLIRIGIGDGKLYLTM